MKTNFIYITLNASASQAVWQAQGEVLNLLPNKIPGLLNEFGKIFVSLAIDR